MSASHPTAKENHASDAMSPVSPTPQFATSALKLVLKRAKRVILHADGTHGVLRQESDATALLERAGRELYLMLDLGHILRFYFGDDYFDLVLHSNVPYRQSEEEKNDIEALKRENEANSELT